MFRIDSALLKGNFSVLLKMVSQMKGLGRCFQKLGAHFMIYHRETIIFFDVWDKPDLKDKK